ncbi:MAG: type VI secretion system membrane subunit TssM, partial [Mesorhizobium sp.]
PELVERYGREFAAAWNGVLEKLKFKAMLEDNYIALSAAASPSSPIDQLFTAIADETALTRDAGPSEESGSEAEAGMLQNQPQNAADIASGLARIGIQIAGGKSQSRAGTGSARAQNQYPGANIEAQFRSFQTLVNGPT